MGIVMKLPKISLSVLLVAVLIAFIVGMVVDKYFVKLIED